MVLLAHASAPPCSPSHGYPFPGRTIVVLQVAPPLVQVVARTSPAQLSGTTAAASWAWAMQICGQRLSI